MTFSESLTQARDKLLTRTAAYLTLAATGAAAYAAYTYRTTTTEIEMTPLDATAANAEREAAEAETARLAAEAARLARETAEAEAARLAAPATAPAANKKAGYGKRMTVGALFIGLVNRLIGSSGETAYAVPATNETMPVCYMNETMTVFNINENMPVFNINENMPGFNGIDIPCFANPFGINFENKDMKICPSMSPSYYKSIANDPSLNAAIKAEEAPQVSLDQEAIRKTLKALGLN